MQSLGSIVGEQTAAGKALGIASALINTYIGASEVIRAKSTLPEPFGTINKIANVAAIVATGIKSVRAITSVQVPGAAGGGGQNINSNIAAPLAPQASVTTLNQAQVNQIGNIAAKAYVVESDVTGNQERIRRLNRAARIS
jgi:ribosomal protein S13